MNIQSSRIAFLVYDNRSGSTFLARHLNNNTKIGVTLESNVLLDIIISQKTCHSSQAVTKFVSKILKDNKFPQWGISREKLTRYLNHRIPLSCSELFKSILECYFLETKPSSEVFIYKVGSPIFLKMLMKHFPQAKIIYIYRDGRAVYSSKKRAFDVGRSRPMDSNPIHAAKNWKKTEKMIAEVQKDFSTVEVKYEKLVKKNNETIQKVYEYLMPEENGLKHVDLTLKDEYSDNIPENQKHLHSNVAKAPMLSRIDAWRKEISEKECYFYEKTAKEALLRRGYKLFCQEPENIRQASILIFFRLLLYWRSLLHITQRAWFYFQDRSAFRRKLSSLK